MPSPPAHARGEEKSGALSARCVDLQVTCHCVTRGQHEECTAVMPAYPAALTCGGNIVLMLLFFFSIVLFLISASPGCQQEQSGHETYYAGATIHSPKHISPVRAVLGLPQCKTVSAGWFCGLWFTLI